MAHSGESQIEPFDGSQFDEAEKRDHMKSIDIEKYKEKVCYYIENPFILYIDNV